MISGCNSEPPPYVTNLYRNVAKELHVYGFLVFSLLNKYTDPFYADVPARIANGELRYSTSDSEESGTSRRALRTPVRLSTMSWWPRITAIASFLSLRTLE